MKTFYFLIGVAIGSFFFAAVALAAPVMRLERTLLPETNNLYDLGTSTQKWRTIYSTTASTTNLTISGTPGCSSTQALVTNSSGTVSCGTISGSSASTTLLGDTNTWSGSNTFNNTITGSISGNAGTVTNGVYTTTFNTLFDNRLSASSSISGITTLPNLSLPYSQLTGTPTISGWPFDATSYGVSTTSVIKTGGLITTASSTLNIFAINNLTSAGFVKTAAGTGVLSVDTNTYLTGVTADSPLSGAGTSASHLVLSTSGTWSGNAGTATALAADGANCSAGNYPLGVDASGAVQNCTAAAVGTVTGVTATWPVISSGGAAPNITWGGISTSSAISAASGFFYATGANTFASVSTSSPISLSITGNAGTATSLFANGANCSAGNYPLGVDASGAVEGCTAVGAGSAFPFTSTLNYGTTANSTSTPIWFAAGLQASSTSQFDNATTSQLTVTGKTWLLNSKSALQLTDANGLVSAYGGAAACTNQVVTALSATGGTTCSSVANAMLSNSSLTVNGTAISLGGSGTITAASSTLLANFNTFSGGNMLLASTTIGNGLQAGGLTISGGATTTGFVFVGTTANNVTINTNGSVYETSSGSIVNQYNAGSGSAASFSLISASDPNGSSIGHNGFTHRFFVTVNTNEIISIPYSTGLVGIGTTSPYARLSVVGETVAAYFTATTTSVSTFPYLTSTYASSTQFSAASQNFYIDSTGHVTAKDTVNGWSGVLSPTHAFVLGTGTTTTWTASTTGSAYSPYLVMPFAGTLRQGRCIPKIGATDGSFLGVNIKVNGSNATPSYFVASSTIGKITFTSGNTFTAGQIILIDFGTTTTATASSISCTLEATET